MNDLINGNRECFDKIWNKIDKKLSKVAIRSRNKLPYTTINGVHDNQAETKINWWTNGFWGGMMWLMYLETGNEEYKKTAQNAEKILNGAFFDAEKLHHDVGFMWHLTSGANYRITGDKISHNTNFIAATMLASRYNIDGEFIRAWNVEGSQGWSIIDCMMNIPLLYWASAETGDDRFKKIAMKHADMSLRDHIRADGSINHIVEHNPDKNEVIKIHGGQGYSETSCWTRGLAWAIYGTVLSYVHTGKKEYLDAAVKTSNYFIANVKVNDYLTPVDFKAPKEPVYYDSTAGLCAACGFLELAKYVSEAEAEMYTDAAIEIIKTTDENFCNYEDNEDSIVQKGTERYPLESMDGVHIPIIYGDFFLVEAMLKLRGNEFLIW